MIITSVYRDVKLRYRSAVEDGRITRRGIILAAVLVLGLYIGSVMMFIGMNFWLWSFTKGLKRSYASMLIPTLLWCGLFLCSLLLVALYHRFHKGRFENYAFWVTRRGVLLLFLIGLFDSLTGLTGMYATVHVPQILQTALISTGPLWTFLFALFIFPTSQPRFTYHLVFVFLFLGGGVALAAIPQALDKSGTKKYFSVPWIFIYLLGTMLFPLYNVLQGRFMHEFRPLSSPFTCAVVMLAVETSIQALLVPLYFPVDFSPFYGTCTSPSESWNNLVDSLRCVHSCHNNGLYMMIYVLGFWIRHVVFAYLNAYSPTVAAITSMLTQPINAFFLLAIPSWNVYGSKKDWRYTLGCFLCLLVGKVLFACWFILYKEPSHAKEAASDAAVTGNNNTEKKYTDINDPVQNACGDDTLQETRCVEDDLQALPSPSKKECA